MGFTFTLLMPKVRHSAWFLVAAGLCWLILLFSTLSRGQPIPGLSADWPRWLLLLAQGGFAACVFLYMRVQPDALVGQNFIGLLRALFRRGLALSTALVVLIGIDRLATAHTLPLPGNITTAVVYTIALALFIVFLAQTLYAWRSLVSLLPSDNAAPAEPPWTARRSTTPRRDVSGLDPASIVTIDHAVAV